MSANTSVRDRSEIRREPARYGRTAVGHVSSAGSWRGWEEMPDWLRSNGAGDPELTPDELRGIRQGAERAARLDIPLGADPDTLWRASDRARRGHG